MTLNIAHGRGDGFHQLLQGTHTTRRNLNSIATLLKNTEADVVALQEADGPSFWSGNFNHVEYLANQGEFRRSVQGTHVDGFGLSYGTALIANLELNGPEAVTFNPALSPVPKGFVVSTITWPGKPCIEIDVVSAHLDFASESIRQKQTLELISRLRARKRPLIIMGDFNTEWRDQDSSVRFLAHELALTTYDPESSALATFPAFGERLDWILVSSDFRFRSYRVIPAIVSDHRGVLAELVLNQAPRTILSGDSCRTDKIQTVQVTQDSTLAPL